MRPCQICRENNWSFDFRHMSGLGETTDVIIAACHNCGNIVKFKAKSKKVHDKPSEKWCEYENRDGKIFQRDNNNENFREVEMIINNFGLPKVFKK